MHDSFGEKTKMSSGRVRLIKERIEHTCNSVLQMHSKIDGLHACMDDGLVGLNGSTSISIPGLITSVAEETPTSSFAKLWEILNYTGLKFYS